MTDTKPLIKAAPGIYLIERIEEKSIVNIGQSKEKQILMGRILDVGPDREHDNGGMMKSFAKRGEIVAFFSYVDGADVSEYEKKKIYCVVFNDLRYIIS